MRSSQEKNKQRSVFDVHATKTHEHKKRNVIEKLIYGRNVVNLRPHFRFRHPWISLFGFLIVISVVFFGVRDINTRAAVSDFYPSTCLGDWQNPSNAAGQPETMEPTGLSFSEANSAIFTASGTQIFCGGFVPPGFSSSGTITNVGITLVWQVGNAPLSATILPSTAPSVILSSSTASASSTANITTSDAVSAPTSAFAPMSTPSSTNVKISTSTASPASSSSAFTPRPSSTPTAAPVVDPGSTTISSSPSSFAPLHNWFSFLIHRAFAENVSSSIGVGTTDTSTVILAPLASVASPGVSSDVSSSTPVGTPTDAISSATSSAVVFPAASSSPDENFLQVSYSTDGSTWIPIQEVSESDWQNLTITLPVTDWSDLAKLQIRVAAIPTSLAILPPVYLDGMLMEVHYNISPSIGMVASPEAAGTISGGSPVIIPVPRSNAPVPMSGNSNFGSNEAPSFNFNLGDLPAPPAPEASGTVSLVATSSTSSDLLAPSSSSVPLPTFVPSAGTSTDASSTTGFLLQLHRLLASAVHFFLAALPTGDRAFAQSVNAPLPTAQNPIVAEILDPEGNVTSLQPMFVVTGSDLQIVLPKSGRAFRPGAYSLELWVWQNGTVYYSASSFTWGVFVVNFNKSIYTTGDTVHMGFAVLTSQGETVCDAPIAATVTSPSGKIFRFTTSDGTIVPNPTCGPQTVTDAPDYAATMAASEAGTYAMTVTAEAGSGSRTLSDSFEVQAAPAFDVSRTAPTRIYPPDPYIVTIHIAAHQNYTGPITETLPSSFHVIPQTFAQKSFSGDAQTLSWNVQLKKGDTLDLSYSFLAPDISPQMYLLGPLTIGSWQETRQWQIAADAVSVIVLTSTASTTWTVPSDWNNASNTIEVIGAGGSGGAGATAQGGGGGGAGAGAYAKILNFTTTSGATIKLQVGGGGAASAANGNISFFNWNGSGSTSTCSGTTMSVCAAAGAAGTTAVGSTGAAAGGGGLTTASIGLVTYAGGAGGAGGAAGGNNGGAGGGAGGAAGLSAAGNNGTAGALTTGGPGGQGDGISGGAGGPANTAGSNGTEWSTSPAYGSGGGGGGASGGGHGSTGISGGAGGSYGAAGAGGSGGGKSGGAGGSGGVGTQGIIIITYTPVVTGPTISNLVLNGGTSLTLSPATTTIITLTASTTAGGNPLSSASALIYRTSLGAGCTGNNLNCYQIPSSSCAFSGASTTVTCSANIWYFAQATDASSSYPTDSWSGKLTVEDSGGGIASSTSSAVTLNTLLAINVTPASINYGTLSPNTNTGIVNQTTTIADVGNSSTTMDLSGTAFIGSGSSIATSSQHYATSSFSFGGTEMQLSDIPAIVSGFILIAPTSTVSVQKNIYWGDQVPFGISTGTYAATITFTAIFSQ